MPNKLHSIVVAATFMGCLASSADAGLVTIDHTDRGWVNGVDNTNNPGLSNTFTGRNGTVFGSNLFRSYFVFDLSSLSAAVTSGTLDLEFEAWFGNGATETVNVYDYTGSIASLTTAASVAGGYSDLGGGNLYGTAVLNSSQVGTVISISLSAAAIADINNAAGGLFALGLSSQSVTGSGEDGVRFSAFREARTHQLNLQQQEVPEPSSLALLGMGVAGLGGYRIRRKRQQAS